MYIGLYVNCLKHLFLCGKVRSVYGEIDKMDTDEDPNFEPQIRARSNTWPLRPNREVLEAQTGSPVSDELIENHREKDPLGLNTKKSGSRRNAWGNLSYADLITKAIQSSPEKRLTLSQIYDWMVQNVPYFKDKGDSTSSAGWKVSIFNQIRRPTSKIAVHVYVYVRLFQSWEFNETRPRSFALQIDRSMLVAVYMSAKLQC